jgi:hypothetical protein
MLESSIGADLWTITRGIFIGVATYADRTEESWLPGARKGARALAKHFQDICPDGSWELWPESDDVLPKRAEVQARLRAWTGKLEEGGSGLCYIASHGASSNNDLIIEGYDYCRETPIDTGISLRLVLDIFAGALGSRILVIIDCCRSGGGLYRLNIPSNVALVFMASEGERVYEVNGLSSLAHVLTAGTFQCPIARGRDGKTVFQLPHFIRALRRDLRSNSLKPRQDCVAHGDSVVTMGIPAKEDMSRQLSPWLTTNCTAILRSELLSPEFTAEVRSRVASYWSWWTGYSQIDVEQFVQDVRPNVRVDPCGLIIRLPGPGVNHEAGAFVDFVLGGAHGAFVTLQVEWRRRLGIIWLTDHHKPSWVRVLASAGDTAQFTWAVGRYVGLCRYSEGRDGSRATVTCQNERGSSVGLENLASSLRYVVDWLMWLEPLPEDM